MQLLPMLNFRRDGHSRYGDQILRDLSDRGSKRGQVLYTKTPGGVLGGLSFSHIRGSPVGFPGSGIWLISRPGFGILKEQGARSGIVIMPGTRDWRF